MCINCRYIDACEKGNLDEMKTIYKEYKNLSANTKCFINACYNGYLHIASWLLSLDEKPNVKIEDDLCFKEACMNGYLYVAEWLMTLDDKPSVHTIIELFCDAFKKGNLEVAEWLFSLEDIQKNINSIFSTQCECGNINLVKWIYNKDNKVAQYEDAFLKACVNGYINIAQWLVTINNNYSIEIEDECIKKYDIKDSIKSLLERKEFQKIAEKLKIQLKDKYEIEGDNSCSICFSNDSNFITSCNHTFCLDCFLFGYIEHNRKKCTYCSSDIKLEESTYFIV